VRQAVERALEAVRKAALAGKGRTPGAAGDEGETADAAAAVAAEDEG
jgi:hypothetical protein